jgi:hypothetical protein
MLVIFMCGWLGFRLSCSYPDRLNILPIVVFGVSFGFFIAQHEQPNLMGYLLHYGTCSFVLLYASAASLGNRQLSGAFVYIAGVTFIYGQYGVVVFLEDEMGVDPAGFLLATVAMGLVWVNAYFEMFPVNCNEDRQENAEWDPQSARYKQLTAVGEVERCIDSNV